MVVSRIRTFAPPLHTARPLRFEYFALHVQISPAPDAVIENHREDCFEIK